MEVRGSCNCGGVTYVVTKPFLRANYCHCTRCRKHSGSNASAQGRVPRDGFQLLSGADLIKVFRPAGGGMVKAFCGECGSSMFGGHWPDGDEVSIRLGTLDDDPGITPQFRTFVGSKAVWDDLPDDGLRRFDTRPM